MAKGNDEKNNLKLQKDKEACTHLKCRMTKMSQVSLSQRLNQKLTLDQSVLLHLSLCTYGGIV
jgi:hypothetical protein